MQCDQCGARRPRSGPCPECGAPAPGTYSSLRQWRNQSPSDFEEEAPRRRSSGTGWGAGAGPGASQRGRRGSGTGWGANDADEMPARSSRRNRRREGMYGDEMDLERALVPLREPMAPVAAGAGLPALPGIPATDEEERALGIRRPVYIPATVEKKVRPSSWRIVSGVLSVLLVCVAAFGLAGLFGRAQISRFFPNAVKTQLTPPSFDFSKVPATPAATPGPDAKYVYGVVTSLAVDSRYSPTRPATHFLTGSSINIVANVRPLPNGERHKVLVRWFLQGVDVGLGRVDGETLTTVEGKGAGVNLRVHFTNVYPAPGLGMAKLYWDLPDNDTGDDPQNAHLAQTIYFAVTLPPTPTPAPTTAPKATGTTTPGKASTGGAPVARRDTPGGTTTGA
ncbi:MAG: hypothetical protein IVW57_00440 [Ktedonobacterales bacterium]|nr:hypothetical protein [Ktedonobacterales bacterium]